MRKGVTLRDDFLDDFDRFNAWARAQEFQGAVNPVDGVEYPDIVTYLPVEIMQEIRDKVGDVGKSFEFMRMTNENTATAPHQAHNDITMGQMTFLLYLQDGEGGTSLVRHKKTGLYTQPRSSYEQRLWERDTNVPDAWEITDMVPMKANRAVWYPSEWMHRAEPIHGFGKDATDGRIALIMFFDKEENNGSN